MAAITTTVYHCFGVAEDRVLVGAGKWVYKDWKGKKMKKIAFTDDMIVFMKGWQIFCKGLCNKYFQLCVLYSLWAAIDNT